MINENVAVLQFREKQPPCPEALNMDLMSREQIIASLEAGRRDWQEGRYRPAEEVFASIEKRLGL